MCEQCDYEELLTKGGLDLTPHRLSVLRAVGQSDKPLSAHEVLDLVNRRERINRVTVYRILELLVEHGLVDRLSSGDRTFRYGLAPNANHLPHPHFYCLGCGRMECLDPDSLNLDLGALSDSVAGAVERVQVRLDGMCRQCLRGRKNA